MSGRRGARPRSWADPRLLAAAALALALVVPVTALPVGGAGAGTEALPSKFVFGHSVDGRALTAVRLGDPSAARVGLVVGVIHGDERAGLRVTRELRRNHRDVQGAQIWVVNAVNPDGLKRGTRVNAHGVDLNRNFSYRWQDDVPRSSGYYPGPHPFSEPESRAVRRLVDLIRPDVSIWYHQPWGAVLACHGRPRIARRYAKLAGMRTSCRGLGLPGTAIGWEKHRFPGSRAFVVEFGRGKLSGRAARRNARAVVAVTRELQARRAAGARAASAGAPRPNIRKWLIPFPKHRKREMAAYSKRHYGQYQWRLRHPRTIVEHYSVTDTAREVWNTFAPDVPDVEFHELPGVCAHFVVSPKGRIYKLVPVSIRCRHTVGLNYVAIGIEHVGRSDAQILHDKPELRHSLKLTRYLRCRFGIKVKYVIGHNESLSSPFYKELDPRFRGQTHADWNHHDMRIYRRKLRKLGGC